MQDISFELNLILRNRRLDTEDMQLKLMDLISEVSRKMYQEGYINGRNDSESKIKEKIYRIIDTNNAKGEYHEFI